MIPIIIPTGYTYHCTVEGSIFKIVQCEHCNSIYVYKMTRKVASSASDTLFLNPEAPTMAAMEANYTLQQKLDTDCDAIPCLQCGKYQQNMIQALRQDFTSDYWYAGLFGIGTGVVAAIAAFLTCSNVSTLSLLLAGTAFVCIGGGAIALRWHKTTLQQFDPNASDLAERMQLAKRFAKTLDEFQAYLQHLGIEWQLPTNPETSQSTNEDKPLRENRRRRYPRLG